MPEPGPEPEPEAEEQKSTAHVGVSGDRRMLEGMLELDPETMDPRYKYKFVKDDRLRIARHRMRGYRPVRREQGGVSTIIDLDDSADGLIRVGDTILMQAPRHRIDQQQAAQRDLATKRLGSTKRRVKEMGEKKGVEVFDGNKHDKD